MRAPRAAVAALLLAVLLSSTSAAQVIGRPIKGGFEEIFMVNGRVVDENGWPVNQALLTVHVTGLKGIHVPPFQVGTNCNGDFTGYIDLRDIPDTRGKVRVTLEAPEEELPGFEPVSVEQPVDTLYRRNDFVLKLPFSWPSDCMEARGYWMGRVTVWGRAVHGVGTHDLNGTTLFADPVQYWPVDINVSVEEGGRVWPPDSVIPTDERGDFKYSYTFDENVTQAHVIIRVKDTVITRADYDPLARVAFVKINTGVDPPRDTPAPGPLLALAAGLIALAIGGARPRRPG